MSLDLILRCRAAAYLHTSLVVMSTAEYHHYLAHTIDYRYPHLKVWDGAYRAAYTQASVTGIPLVECLRSQIELILASWQNVPSGFLDNLVIAVPHIAKLYQALTFQGPRESEDIDLFEWWLGTPTGAESCSRDIGELRNSFEAGKGDEWELDIEAAVLQYQLDQQPFILVPTGYACAETLRRLRMNG